MPSRNSKSNSTDRENYMHCLDQLGEILNTYSGTHAVIILGDMNASLKARKGNLQDTLLIDFVSQHDLSWRQSGEETFFLLTKLTKPRLIISSSINWERSWLVQWILKEALPLTHLIMSQ